MNSKTLKAALAACFLLLGSRQLPARQGCTNADFAGSWGFLGTGAVLYAPPDRPIVGPFARLGRMTSIGDGRVLAAYERGTYNGVVYRDPFDGTYTVNSDCTIVFVLNAPAPVNLPITFVGLLTENNREARVVTSAPGAVVAATLRRQSQYWCVAEDFSGAYAFDMTGVILPPSSQAGPFARVGRLVTFGAGSFTANTTANYNGQIVPENMTGTYTVDAECKLVMNATATGPAGSQDFTIEGVMSDRRNVQLLITKPGGLTITGGLLKQ